jgi:hypothetical protein
MTTILHRLLRMTLICLLAQTLWAAEAARHIPISLSPDDVIATGNEWVALPTIRAVDGAVVNFNVLSMRDRGLLQVDGERGTPALVPYFMVDGKRLPFKNPAWELIEYWIPVAHLSIDGLDATVTYCAPADARGAFIDMRLTNRLSKPVPVALGLKASWGALNRVTYTPVELRGDRAIVGAPWEKLAQDFTFVTSDTVDLLSRIGRQTDGTAIIDFTRARCPPRSDSSSRRNRRSALRAGRRTGGVQRFAVRQRIGKCHRPRRDRCHH